MTMSSEKEKIRRLELAVVILAERLELDEARLERAIRERECRPERQTSAVEVTVVPE